MTRHAYQRAEDVYRLRFLSEKYGVDPRDWLDGVEFARSDPDGGAELPDVVEILEEEILEEERRTDA